MLEVSVNHILDIVETKEQDNICESDRPHERPLRTALGSVCHRSALKEASSDD